MRASGALAFAAALIAAPAAAGVPGQPSAGGAGSPVRTHPLGPDELLVEVGGIGVVTTRADLATITATVQAYGDGPAAARRAAEGRARELVAAARRAGVPADAIEVRHGQALTAMTVFDVLEEPPPAEDASAGNDQDASTITIRLRDIDRAPALGSALTEAGAAVSPITYSLIDRTEARRAARAQALAMAEADAEAYAAATNRRVARLVRLTDRIGFDIYGLAINNAALMQNMRGMQDPSAPQTSPEITTIILLGADYALAPR